MQALLILFPYLEGLSFLLCHPSMPSSHTSSRKPSLTCTAHHGKSHVATEHLTGVSVTEKLNFLNFSSKSTGGLHHKGGAFLLVYINLQNVDSYKDIEKQTCTE